MADGLVPPDPRGYPDASRRGCRSGRLRVLSLVSLALFFAAWEAGTRFALFPPVLVPAPSSLIAAFRRELNSGILTDVVRASLDHWVLGVAVGSVLGIGLGGAAGLWIYVEAAQEGIARLLRPISPIAWIPFAIMWFGVSRGAAAFIIAIGVFWINYFATLTAVRSVDPALLELAGAFGQGSLHRRVLKVILPGAAPGILSGLRSGLGMSWIVVLVAELFGVRGIGQRMMEASGFLATDVVLLYMVTISVLYTLCDVTVTAFTRRILRWMP
ncbi:MAG TPA: ABC transporter permease [Rhizomicrobium sp.]|nr:ABC transporter permease [Rhizomicrobium sp.]